MLIHLQHNKGLCIWLDAITMYQASFISNLLRTCSEYVMYSLAFEYYECVSSLVFISPVLLASKSTNANIICNVGFILFLNFIVLDFIMCFLTLAYYVAAFSLVSDFHVVEQGREFGWRCTGILLLYMLTSES